MTTPTATPAPQHPDEMEAGRRFQALDLFCKAGGASMGLYRTGFDVTGVDIEPQPRYPFRFIQADALTFDLSGFDFIWASPPCQAYSDMRVMSNARPSHPELVEPIRERLTASGLPWIIENVEGAPLTVGPPSLFSKVNGVVLCGSMFGLFTDEYQLRRHRLFESNVWLTQPACRHGSQPVVGFYGDHARIRRRANGTHRGTDIVGKELKMRLARELLGIDWMDWGEISQAIPPAYGEFLGRQVMAHLETRAERAA